ncbi:hypothetical protein [Nonomuraea typhae]|uniref:Uncharacterized protein n=1 Tax=Nonomuraea typhae TaxID=2603600 RepID=A0ABW7YJF8_9ACTN
MSNTTFPLIDIKSDDETRQIYVKNIIAVYESTTADQLARGRAWYQTAHDLALMISGGNIQAGAGVIAALSANKRWADNVKLATRAFVAGKATGHVGDALRKATRIMAGESPENVLPMDSKTGHFYRCIVNPTDSDAICLDRHAHDIAVGTRYGDHERGLSSKGRYALLASIYREAATRLGELPQVVQAVTWVAWIESR